MLVVSDVDGELVIESVIPIFSLRQLAGAISCSIIHFCKYWYYSCVTYFFVNSSDSKCAYFYYFYLCKDVFLPCPESLLVNLREFKEVGVSLDLVML